MSGQMFYKRKSDGLVVPINPGPQGEIGPQGPPGGAVLSGKWNYNDATTGPANTGQVRTNISAGTGMMWLSNFDADGLSWSGVTVNPGDSFYIRDNSGNLWMLEVVEITAQGEYSVGVQSSTGDPPRKNEKVSVSLVRQAGDFALADHDHDADYSALGHTHDYANSSHTHNYANSNHSHDFGDLPGAAVEASLNSMNVNSTTKQFSITQRHLSDSAYFTVLSNYIDVKKSGFYLMGARVEMTNPLSINASAHCRYAFYVKQDGTSRLEGRFSKTGGSGPTGGVHSYHMALSGVEYLTTSANIRCDIYVDGSGAYPVADRGGPEANALWLVKVT
jgi:hypothetical protein